MAACKPRHSCGYTYLSRGWRKMPCACHLSGCDRRALGAARTGQDQLHGSQAGVARASWRASRARAPSPRQSRVCRYGGRAYLRWTGGQGEGRGGQTSTRVSSGDGPAANAVVVFSQSQTPRPVGGIGSAGTRLCQVLFGTRSRRTSCTVLDFYTTPQLLYDTTTNSTKFFGVGGEQRTPKGSRASIHARSRMPTS